MKEYKNYILYKYSVHVICNSLFRICNKLLIINGNQIYLNIIFCRRGSFSLEQLQCNNYFNSAQRLTNAPIPKLNSKLL